MNKTKLRTIREQKGLTQKELAERAGVVQSLISMVESGTANFSIKVAKRVCAVLGCKIDDIL